MIEQQIDKAIMVEFDRSPRADKLHAVLGRALALSASFEFNCRVLNTAVGYADEDLSFEDQQSIEEFFQAIVRISLSESIRSFSERLLPATTADAREIRQNFHRARRARNYIIHKAPLKLANVLAGTEDEQKYLVQLREELRHIWRANIQVRFLILIILGEDAGVRGERPGDEEASKWLNWLDGLGR